MIVIIIKAGLEDYNMRYNNSSKMNFVDITKTRSNKIQFKHYFHETAGYKFLMLIESTIFRFCAKSIIS